MSVRLFITCFTNDSYKENLCLIVGFRMTKIRGIFTERKQTIIHYYIRQVFRLLLKYNRGQVPGRIISLVILSFRWLVDYVRFRCRC